MTYLICNPRVWKSQGKVNLVMISGTWQWCKVNTLHRKKNKSMQLELVPKEPRPHDYTSHGKRGW